MISSNCVFEYFVNAVRENGPLDIIYLAEQEATDAWRRSRKETNESELQKNRCYRNKLLGLIKFMRYGIKTADLTDTDYVLLTIMRDQIEAGTTRLGNA